MKKAIITILIITLLFVITGCGKKVYTGEISDYLKDARPESSVISYYVYDGNNTVRYYLGDVDAEKEILEKLSKIKAYPVADWSPSKNDLPFYAIEIGGVNEQISILFAKDMAILGDGRAYSFKCDVPGLMEGRTFWDETHTFSGIILPGEYYCANTMNGWNSDFLNQSTAVINDALKISFSSENEDSLSIKNKTGSTWVYGAEYLLEVCLEGTWYYLPSKTWMVFNDIAYIVESGKTGTLKYDLRPFGDLPQGSYRIVIPGTVNDGEKADGAVYFTKNTYAIVTAMPTMAPGELPDPDDLPDVKESLTGMSVFVNYDELKNSAFEIRKCDNGRIIITKISEVPEDDHYARNPIMTAVFTSNEVVDMEDIQKVLMKGIECTVSDQRYIHGSVWFYFPISFNSINGKDHSKERLSDNVCYGHLTGDEELLLNENLFFDCEATRNGPELVFKMICDHYGIR